MSSHWKSKNPFLQPGSQTIAVQNAKEVTHEAILPIPKQLPVYRAPGSQSQLNPFEETEKTIWWEDGPESTARGLSSRENFRRNRSDGATRESHKEEGDEEQGDEEQGDEEQEDEEEADADEADGEDDADDDAENDPKLLVNEDSLRVIAGPGVSCPRIEINYKIKDKRRKANPIDPAPPQFLRPAQADIADSSSFEPFAIYAIKDELWEGFPEIYPLVLKDFDISEEDWVRFLVDLRIMAGKLGYRGKMAYMALMNEGGYALFKLLRKQAGIKKFPVVKSFVSIWSQKFFEPRGLRVVLQTPKDILRSKMISDPDYEKPKKSRYVRIFGRDETKSHSDRKCRIVIMPKLNF